MDGGLGLVGKRRLALMAGAGLLALSGLGWRFNRLQVDEHALHLRNAKLNTIVVERTVAPRGRMLDAKGRLLVNNQPCYSLEARPCEIRDIAKTAALIAQVAELNPKKVKEKLLKAKRKAPLEPVVLVRVMSARQLARCAVLMGEPKGVAVVPSSHRRYLYGKKASHVLGYMGEISEYELLELKRKRSDYSARDMIGKTGLEKQYDFLVRGIKGIEHHYVDAIGRTVKKVEVKPPVPGPDLHLTIDMGMQRVAEEALARTIRYPHGGAVVAMEPHTGRILALASLPNFDPRPFARGITPKEYSSLVTNPTHPLVARAFECAFSPGSTFKVVTSTAGLAEKFCSPGTVFYCPGNYHGQNCFVTSGHGSISFRDTLALSCDYVYYRMAHEMGIKRLAKYCRLFSLGGRTGIDLPHEDVGLVPTPAWKKKVWNDGWYPYDIINMGIGQGALLVTPLQMAVMTSTVANGGKVYRPYLVEKAVGSNGSLKWQNKPKVLRKMPVKKHHLAAVRNGMIGAVQYGTGGACNLPHIQVAGKTGTVGTDNGFGPNHTWFVSFAPAEKPRLCVVVFLEKTGGYGGSMAAPIARQIYEYKYGKGPAK